MEAAQIQPGQTRLVSGRDLRAIASGCAICIWLLGLFNGV